MQEIKKYTDQEIQRYTHALGVLAGKLQGSENKWLIHWVNILILNIKKGVQYGSRGRGDC